MNPFDCGRAPREEASTELKEFLRVHSISTQSKVNPDAERAAVWLKQVGLAAYRLGWQGLASSGCEWGISNRAELAYGAASGANRLCKCQECWTPPPHTTGQPDLLAV